MTAGCHWRLILNSAAMRRKDILYSPVFAKNTSVSRIFGESSSKISADGGILGKGERVLYPTCANSSGALI